VLRARFVRELRAPLPATMRTAGLHDALLRSLARSLEQKAARVAGLAQSLAHLNPEGVLARGYAIVSDAGGGIVTDAAQVSPGDEVSIALARGKARAAITRREN
jgi:exodeoxyribonuclease VII large subunit